MALTVAVKVTASPWVDGFCDDVIVVVVVGWFTVCVRAVLVLTAKLASPL